MKADTAGAALSSMERGVVIGSNRKAVTIPRALGEEGSSFDDLACVHSPVDLPRSTADVEAGASAGAPEGPIAAVVLAAGKSSRIGTSKALLPLGSATALERLIVTLSRAGVEDIVVVTGHEPRAMVNFLEELSSRPGAPPVRVAHNAGYEAGMFSSVQTGARALSTTTAAFFVMPVDCPLVRAWTLERLIAVFRLGGGDILHPTWRGRRGHPPLIASRYRQALLQASASDNLGSFLKRYAKDEVEVDVEDDTILIDMDTAEDYLSVSRLAMRLDAACVAEAGSAAADASAVRALMYLVRHARPDIDDDMHRFWGWSDLPLAEYGREQACCLAQRLRDVSFHAVYSSDLRRCLSTAEIVAGTTRGLPGEPSDVRFHVEKELREINVGSWEGLTFSEARARYPHEYATRERDLVGFRFPGGESFRDLRGRVVPVFWRIASEAEGNVLVVTHKGPIRVLLCELLELPPDRLFSLRPDYVSVEVIAITVSSGGDLRARVITPARAIAPERTL